MSAQRALNSPSQASLKKLLISFLKKNIEHLEHAGGGGSNLSKYHFDLKPRNFLEFAERELSSGQETHHKINTISHLKRAIECQIDTFLASLNLYDVVEKRNLGLDKKLEFLRAISVFSSRTLSRFNTVRNNMEHLYKDPQLQDIEVYFDLASTLIEIIECTTVLIATSSELHFYGNHTLTSEGQDTATPSIPIRFNIGYTQINTTITAEWGEGAQEHQYAVSFEEDHNEFAFMFRIFLLMSKHAQVPDEAFVINKISD